MPAPRFLHGVVLEEDSGNRLAGVTVTARRRDGNDEREAGRATTDGQGRFRIALQGDTAAQGSYRLALSIDGRALEPTEGSRTIVRGGELAREVALCVPTPHLCEPPDIALKQDPQANWAVYGLVRHEDGTPLAGKPVTAFARTIGGTQQLGSADTTDNDGRYQVTFAPPPNNQPPPHLFVQVDDGNVGNPTVIGTSATAFNTSTRTRLDIRLTAESWRGPSEYADVQQRVDAQRGSVAFADLDDEAVAFLVGATLLSDDRVRTYVAAGVLDDLLANIDARERVYGLLRAGWPHPAERFLHHPRGGIADALDRSATRNVISRAAAGGAAALAEAIVTTLNSRMLDAAVTGSSAALFAAAGLTTGQQQAVAARWHTRAGTLDAYWTGLRGEIGDAPVDRLRDAIRLHSWTQSHPPLVEVALAELDGDPLPMIGGWSRALWDEMLDRPWSGGSAVGVPAGIPGNTSSERRENYLTLVRDAAEHAFPGVRVRADIGADQGAPAALVAFLGAFPTFDLGADHVTGSGANADAARKYQRLFRLSPPTRRWNTMSVLGAGLGSAREIVRKGKTRFTSAFASALGGDLAASAVFAKAQFQASAAQLAWAMLSPSLRGDFRFCSSMSGTDDIPDWAELFGSADYCACDPCLSITSPAAYLVGLLAWAYELEDGSTIPADQALDDRRPDLRQIKLSCVNSYTPLPYVDLVNEVLETALLGDAGYTPTINYVETTRDASELLATPEYVVSDATGTTAYDVLASATTDIALPYHLANDQARVYLRQLGLPRSRLLAIMAYPGTTAVVPADAGIDALGLGATDVALIGSQSPSSAPDAATRWGYDPAAAWRTELAVLRTFMLRSGLEYPAVLELLHCRAANPSGTSHIFLDPSDSCDTTEIKLQRAIILGIGPDPTEAQFRRLSRFLRVARALGLPLLDTDRVLAAMGVDDADDDAQLNPAAVVRLGYLRRLADATDRPILALLSWFADIDVYADRTLAPTPNRPQYDRWFLDAAAFPEALSAGWAFALNAGRTDLADTSLALLDHCAPIASALGGTLSEVIAAAEWLRNGGAALNLTLATISGVVRRVELARACKVPVLSLQRLVAARGGDPFTDPASAFWFVEQSRDVLAGAGTAHHALYVVAQDTDAASRVGISSDRVQEDLGGLRDQLRALLTSFDPAADPASMTEAEFTAYLGTLLPSSSGWWTGFVDTVKGAWTMNATNQGMRWAQLKADCTADGALRAALDLRDFRSGLIGADGNAPGVTTTGARFAFAARMLRWGAFRATIGDSLRSAASRQLAALLGRSTGFVERMRGVSVAQFADGLFLPLGDDNGDLVDLLVSRAFVRPDVLDAPGAYVDITGGARAGALPTGMDDAIDLYVLLQKASLFFSVLGVTETEHAWWFDLPWGDVGDPTPFGLLDVRRLGTLEDAGGNAVRYHGYHRARVLFAQRERLPGADPDFATILGYAERYALAPDDFAGAVATRTGWDADELRAICDTFGYATPGPNDLSNPFEFRRMLDAREATARLGTSATTLLGWFTHAATGTDAYDATSDDADGALRVARSRYPTADAWSAVARPLRDGQRIRQRDALVAWLTHQTDSGTLDTKCEDATALFERYLIDPEMSPCMLTSRIKQAGCSVQLYLQRNLLGFDAAGLTLTDDDRDQWEWMKSYRVWEAARKVFLYPENYVDPALRDDKTPLFEAMEGEVTQGTFDSDLAESAVESYARGLGEIASIYVGGIYREKSASRDVLHVVGRSRGEPRTYWYRRRELGAWSPWERIECGVSGGHLLPYAADGRVYLFWAQFRKSGATSTKNGGSWNEIGLHAAERRGSGDWRTLFAADEVADEQAHLVHAYAVDGGYVSYLDFDAADLPSSRRWRLYSGDLDGDVSVSLTSSFDFDTVFGTWSVRPEMGRSSWQKDASWLGSSSGTLSPFYPEYQGYEVDDLWGSVGDGDPATPTQLERMEEGIGTATHTGDVLLTDAVNGATVLFSRDADLQPDERSRYFFLMDGSTRVLWAQKASAGVGDIESTAVTASSGPVIILPTLSVGSGSDLYGFELAYHPYANRFVEEIAKNGVFGLLAPVPSGALYQQTISDEFFDDYAPNDALVSTPGPVKEIEFLSSGAYSAYNWELFFHAPARMANRLLAEQRFDEALDWWHTIFDPRISEGTAPARYWRFGPFAAPVDPDPSNWADFTGEDDAVQRASFEAQVAAWRDDPFNPHLIARLRPGTYQKWVVMSYLDTLIAWGDQLFTRDTIESINEATSLYLLASDVLGERPTELEGEKRSDADMKSFDEIEPFLDAFSNALVTLENRFTFTASLVRSRGGGASSLATGTTPYFCVSPNEKLLAYWDTIADRLFKIRNCLDIKGQARSLALYEPPIDPMLLVRASAMGVDISTALAAAQAALPNHRFAVMHARARAFAESVRGFGGALLTALEKKDAEALALLRSSQEISLLAAVADVRALQVDEAQAAIDSLDAQVGVVQARRDYYAGLIDADLLPGEVAELALQSGAAAAQVLASVYATLAAVTHPIPQAHIGLAAAVEMGGEQVAGAFASAGQAAGTIGSTLNIGAQIAGTASAFDRRKQEWTQQRDLAQRELDQLAVQRLGAEIRLSLTTKERDNHALQQENADAVDAWMRSKYTSQQLYDWMVTRLSGLHLSAYDLAIETARKAEACYRHEIGVQDSSFVQYAYWDSLKSGLLAGESLGHDLDRMEAAYLQNDVREHEMTKPVSLARLDPVALARLQQAGECYFIVPETAFDLDYAGHYLRRIQSVGLTIAAVTGAYGSVNAQLTLHGAEIRRSTTGNIASDGIGGLPSTVTSVAMQDAGLFQLDLRDPRYLPFERRGAVSHWHLKLTADVLRQLDWTTISDVVLHLRYTAKDGGAAFAGPRRAALAAAGGLASLPFAYPDQNFSAQVTPGGAVFLFSAKRDDPDTLYAAQVDATNTTLAVEINEEMLGDLAGRTLSRALVVAVGGGGALAGSPQLNGAALASGSAGITYYTATPSGGPAQTYTLTSGTTLESLDDVVIALVVT
jgi:hypothetical protein